MALPVRPPGTNADNSHGAVHTPPKPKPGPPNPFVKVTQPFDRQTNLSGLTPKQIQKLLRSRGYDVQIDGKMGPQTRSAMDAYVKGKSPQQYNSWAAKHFVSVVMKPASPHRVSVGGSGVVSGAGGSKPPKPGNPPKAGNGLDLNGLEDVGANIGTDLPVSLAGSAASMEFDPQINETQRALDRVPIQGAQNVHDIGHWYGQVLDSEHTAAGRDHDINVAGQNSVKDMVGRIVASLGGGANQGSGLVAGTGADALGELAASGAAQEQYNQDIRPLLQSEAAGASTRERARQTQEMSDISGRLSDLKGAKGSATSAKLLDILDRNNSLAETRFQNRLALAQAREAALLTGAKVLTAGAKANTPGKGSYAATSPTQKLGIMQTAVQTIAGPDGKLRVPIDRAVQLVNNVIAGAGWDRSNPAVLNFRNQILMSVGITPNPAWK